MRAQTDSGERRRPVAKKRFGQNFLEPVWAQKVVDAIAPQTGDTFIEIGPGPGAITRLLAARVRALIACEIDRDLAAALQAEAIPSVQVMVGDFLHVDAGTLTDAIEAAAPGADRVRVAGNLPYNVASPIMFRLVELARGGFPLHDATIMLQREVADRLLAAPGSRDYGVLSVLIGHRARVQRLLNLPPGAFRPAPKVHSSVVRLTFAAPTPAVTDEAVLAAITNAVFSRRRKTMGNALLAHGSVTPATAGAALARAGIDPGRRPETLSIAEFAALADAVAST